MNKGTLRIEYDDVSMKTKLFLSAFVKLRFNGRSVLTILSEFTIYWVYKPTQTVHVGKAGIYTYGKISNLRTKNKKINQNVIILMVRF